MGETKILEIEKKIAVKQTQTDLTHNVKLNKGNIELNRS